MNIIDATTQQTAKPIIEMPELQTDGNRFQILNGNWLEGYPLAEPQTTIDNQLQLDTTGQYLSVGRQKPRQNLSLEETAKTFYTNAFLFWNYREVIYSDSRMFLAPVPVKNGLAYTGTSGFRCPTLGIYLEWWERCDQAHFFVEKGLINKHNEERLIWYFAGSALSGSNLCASVNKTGEIDTTSTCSFSKVWRSFVEVNTRYDEIKQHYQTFTLEQIVDILNSEGNDFQKRITIELQQQQILNLSDEIEYWKSKYYKYLISPHQADLDAMLQRYHYLISEATKEPIKKKKELLLYWADTCIFDVLHRCYPEKITNRREAREVIPIIEKYLCIQ